MKTQHEYSKEQITAMLVSHLERFAVRQKNKPHYTPAVSASTRRHPVANWTVRKVA